MGEQRCIVDGLDLLSGLVRGAWPHLWWLSNKRLPRIQSFRHAIRVVTCVLTTKNQVTFLLSVTLHKKDTRLFMHARLLNRYVLCTGLGRCRTQTTANTALHSQVQPSTTVAALCSVFGHADLLRHNYGGWSAQLDRGTSVGTGSTTVQSV